MQSFWPEFYQLDLLILFSFTSIALIGVSFMAAICAVVFCICAIYEALRCALDSADQMDFQSQRK